MDHEINKVFKRQQHKTLLNVQSATTEVVFGILPEDCLSLKF